MRGQLDTETRLRINVTRLKNSATNYRATIAKLKTEIKEKDRKIAELEAKLTDKEAQRKELLTYLYKPGKKEAAALPRFKKPGAPAYHRLTPKDEDITASYTYELAKCPLCKETVGGVVDKVIKYTEDIDLQPKPLITKHTITRHWCRNCETYVKSQHIPPISRIGINVAGYLLYARYRLRLPIEKIRESLQDLYRFKISEGEVVEKLKEAQEWFGKDYEAITALIQESNRVYADETGWRMDGKNWWLWVFVTERGVQYVIEDTRGKGVPERVLGTKTDRVIISDGYAAYQNLPGDKQQCWVHLLRVAKNRSATLYEDLVLLYKKLLLELEKPIVQRDKESVRREFDALIEKGYPEPEVHSVKTRMKNHRVPLFTCLDHEGVLPENNTAERAIRPQVVMRKIFGGSRSLAGAQAHQVNTSVIETLRKQNLGVSFFDMVLPLLEKRSSGL